MEILRYGKIVDMIALDLKKAFDTVNHEILLQKLEHCGSELTWFSDYLSGRQQRALINGKLSDSRQIETGVPQGSILRPLRFILYVNDLPLCLNSFTSNMCADDTAFYFGDDDVNRVETNLQSDLTKVRDWLNCNKLSLNVAKTTSMVICSWQ